MDLRASYGYLHESSICYKAEQTICLVRPGGQGLFGSCSLCRVSSLKWKRLAAAGAGTAAGKAACRYERKSSARGIESLRA